MVKSLRLFFSDSSLEGFKKDGFLVIRTKWFLVD